MMEPIFSETDVLIIGAGPAGLMAALWLTRCGIDVRIIDRRATKVFRGQADSLQVRTMEIFDSFEMADGINRDGAHLMESSFWASDDDSPITHVGTASEYYPESSRFHQILIHQGRIEREFLDNIKRLSGVEVERGVQPSMLEIDETNLDDPQSHSVKVTVEHMSAEELASSPWSLPLPRIGVFSLSPGDEKELERGISPKSGATEVISAKYVIGADGARSWTRNQLGFKLEGSGIDPVYGVMDMIAKTDFPDARKRAIINTPLGACFFIPREDGILRLGVKLDTPDRTLVTPEVILKQVQDIIKPYKIECIHYDWHTGFQSNQRHSNYIAKFNRVFLAGDAIHIHSPKAGIGMNFSLQDTYNLGWKLVHVLKGLAKPSLLDTYISERRQVAEDLIKCDEELSAAFLGVSPNTISIIEQSRKFYETAWPFTSCTGIEYKPSAVVAMSKSKPEVASRIVIGQRLVSQLVVNQASGQPVELQSRLPSDGKYRVIVFGGDISYPEELSRLKIFGEAVITRKSFSKFERINREFFEVLLVHAAGRDEVKWAAIPEVFRPWSETTGEWYEGVWTDNSPYTGNARRAYDGYGIDRKKGALVLVRPDGHVMFINKLENLAELECVLSDILFVAN